MYNMDERTVRDILKKKFQSLVGKTCKRIEVLRDNKDIADCTKLNLVRDLIKELDYETMREIQSSIELFSNGTKIQVTLIKPER